jgi:hypothetical protein
MAGEAASFTSISELARMSSSRADPVACGDRHAGRLVMQLGASAVDPARLLRRHGAVMTQMIAARNMAQEGHRVAFLDLSH